MTCDHEWGPLRELIAFGEVVEILRTCLKCGLNEVSPPDEPEGWTCVWDDGTLESEQ